MPKLEFAKKSKEFRRTLPKQKKICKECGDSFLGIYNRKYCDKCQSGSVYVKNHKKAKSQQTKDYNNRVIQHISYECRDAEVRCDCCGKPFMIRLLPRVYTYPRFCESHRNPWKREMYNRINRK